MVQQTVRLRLLLLAGWWRSWNADVTSADWLIACVFCEWLADNHWESLWPYLEKGNYIDFRATMFSFFYHSREIELCAA